MTTRLFMSPCLALLAGASWLALGASAQDATHQNPATTPETVIDGALHPDQIPDSVAYRLWFLTVSTVPNPTTKDKARQASHLGMIGLESGDRQQLLTILADFRLQWTKLVNDYNESARAAISQNSQPDTTTFLQKRDDLVQHVRDTLKQVLTPDGMGKLDAFVRSEKRSMKIDAKEAQP